MPLWIALILMILAPIGGIFSAVFVLALLERWEPFQKLQAWCLFPVMVLIELWDRLNQHPDESSS